MRFPSSFYGYVRPSESIMILESYDTGRFVFMPAQLKPRIFFYIKSEVFMRIR